MAGANPILSKNLDGAFIDSATQSHPPPKILSVAQPLHSIGREVTYGDPEVTQNDIQRFRSCLICGT